mmetsp:Transcript_99479/g.172689  ORF Transcript_99479/g.172689 Transcript_99479/m.172689 type:complete len:209 (+) Transcript_99479:264-890(+)
MQTWAWSPLSKKVDQPQWASGPSRKSCQWTWVWILWCTKCERCLGVKALQPREATLVVRGKAERRQALCRRWRTSRISSTTVRTRKIFANDQDGDGVHDGKFHRCPRLIPSRLYSGPMAVRHCSIVRPTRTALRIALRRIRATICQHCKVPRRSLVTASQEEAAQSTNRALLLLWELLVGNLRRHLHGHQSILPKKEAPKLADQAHRA